MRSKVLFILWLGGGTVAMPQAPGLAGRVFTRAALASALSRVTEPAAVPQDPRSDWSRLRQLATGDIVVFAQGLAGRRCRLVAVEDSALTVVDLESSNRARLRIVRTDVDEIKGWTGRHGSPLGAVIGATIGVVAGAGLSIALALKQCGGSCADEKLLIGVSLVGMPIAGGFLGYRLPGGTRTLTTIYVRP